MITTLLAGLPAPLDDPACDSRHDEPVLADWCCGGEHIPLAGNEQPEAVVELDVYRYDGCLLYGQVVASWGVTVRTGFLHLDLCEHSLPDLVPGTHVVARGVPVDDGTALRPVEVHDIGLLLSIDGRGHSAALETRTSADQRHVVVCEPLSGPCTPQRSASWWGSFRPWLVDRVNAWPPIVWAGADPPDQVPAPVTFTRGTSRTVLAAQPDAVRLGFLDGGACREDGRSGCVADVLVYDSYTGDLRPGDLLTVGLPPAMCTYDQDRPTTWLAVLSPPDEPDVVYSVAALEVLPLWNSSRLSPIPNLPCDGQDRLYELPPYGYGSEYRYPIPL